MSNLNNNRLNGPMTATQVTAVKAALQTIITNMPFLTGLTLEERIALPKININNKVFVEDCINVLSNNPGFMPSFITPAMVQADYNLYTQLYELAGLVGQLLEKIEDTRMLAGSEAYIASLTAYKVVAAASQAGIPGADTYYESLRTRFLQQSTNTPDNETPQETP